jgi:diaphanous 1
MKETRTARGGTDCPTLLHYLARVLLRTDPSLISFTDDLPHLDAAARGQFDSQQSEMQAGFSGNSFCSDCHAIRQLFGPWLESGKGGDQTVEATPITCSKRSIRTGYAGGVPIHHVQSYRLSPCQPFVAQVSPTVEALKKMGASVEEELQSLLVYYGERPDSPEAPKPEDFFGLISSFASSLQVGLMSYLFMTMVF